MEVGIAISLSTVVLNNRDQWEIIWLLENFVLYKSTLQYRLYPKKTGWNAVPWLNEADLQPALKI